MAAERSAFDFMLSFVRMRLFAPEEKQNSLLAGEQTQRKMSTTQPPAGTTRGGDWSVRATRVYFIHAEGGPGWGGGTGEV